MAVRIGPAAGRERGERAGGRTIEWGCERGERAGPPVSDKALLTAGEQPTLFARGKALPVANCYSYSPGVRAYRWRTNCGVRQR